METNKNIKILKEWSAQQPHLPKEIPDVFLMKFLIVCDNDLESSKNLVDSFFTFRSKSPDLFADRDLDEPGIQDTIEIFDMYKLSKTVGNNQVYVINLKTDDASKFHFVAAMRTFLIYDDVQLFTDDQPYEGDIFLVDMRGATLRHLSKMSLKLKYLKKMMDYIQEVRPTNLKEIHVLNAPFFVDKFLLIIKPFVKAEIFKMIKVHATLDKLHQNIPKEILPEEYGGLNGTIVAYKKEWDDKIRNHKHIIEDETNWKLDESKRPGDNPHGYNFETQASFRSLQID